MLIIVSCSLQLSEGHRMAVFRDTERWLHINRHQDCNNAIHYLVEETEASTSPSLLQTMPTQSFKVSIIAETLAILL